MKLIELIYQFLVILIGEVIPAGWRDVVFAYERWRDNDEDDST